MEKWTPTKAGLYPEMTRAEYDACDAMNQSTLKHGLRSMSALKAAIERGYGEPSDAMRLGTLIHTCILEPELVDERHLVIPDLDLRFKKDKQIYQEARDEAGDRELIQQSDFDQARQISILLDQTPHAMNLLHPDLIHECAAIWWDVERSSVWCKALIDGYLPGRWIVDIKTTRDASPLGFQRSIVRYGYHIQAAFYQHAIDAVTGDGLLPFYIIALETSDPPQLAVYHMSDEAIDIGRQEYHRLLGEYAACKRHDIWPSYATDIQEIGLPPWAMRGGVLQETF